METSVFKIFLSKEKEEKWLNSMGKNGYALLGINDSKYRFDKSDDHTYSYSIEYLTFSPKSEEAIDYFKSREDEGIVPLVSSGNWVYFGKTDGVIISNADVYKRNAGCYFWRMLYLLFFAVCDAIVCGYQAFAIGFLDRMGQNGNGLISKTFDMSKSTDALNVVLNALKKVANIFIKMINKYFEVWTSIFSESDAVAVISVVAPITVVLLVIGALNFERYASYRKRVKTSLRNQPTVEETEGELNAEQAI